jgi:hypothetical protein
MARSARYLGELRAPVIGFLAMIGILLLMESIGMTQQTVPRGRDFDGFRELKWGTSLEQASKTYPDLGFERYVVSNGKEEPWKVYVRGVEHADIESVPFDSIEYWFQEDHLHQVRAVLRSRIGPRTLVTRAENAFEKLAGRLKGRYGAPSEDKVDFLTEFIVVVKEATWAVDHSAITIRYEGAGKTNEDLLTLILREAPRR